METEDARARYDIDTDAVMFARGEAFDVAAAGDAQQPFTLPKGVMHFPHARGRVVVLRAEKAGVVPTGN